MEWKENKTNLFFIFFADIHLKDESRTMISPNFASHAHIITIAR